MATQNLPAVIPVSDYTLITMPMSEIQEAFAANFGDEGIDQFTLDQVHVPTGGNTAWMVPTLEGRRAETAITGVIVYWNKTRALFTQEFSGDGVMPDCRSVDMVTGVGEPGGDCETCPFNQWSSDLKGGAGKACKEKQWMFILRPEDVLPIAVVVPSSSLSLMRDYFRSLSRAGAPYYGVVTSFTLRATRAKTGGVTYSEVVPEFRAKLSREEVQRMREFSEMMRETISARADPLPPAGAPIIDVE